MPASPFFDCHNILILLFTWVRYNISRTILTPFYCSPLPSLRQQQTLREKITWHSLTTKFFVELNVQKFLKDTPTPSRFFCSIGYFVGTTYIVGWAESFDTSVTDFNCALDSSSVIILLCLLLE